MFKCICRWHRPQIMQKTKRRKQRVPDMSLLIVAIWINSLTIGHTAYGTHLAIQHPIDVEEYDGSYQIGTGEHIGNDAVEGDEAIVGVGNIRGIENREMHGFHDDITLDSQEQQQNMHQFDMLNHDELLDIREESAVNTLPEKDLPKFGELLQNVTVPVGREAVLQCVVDNLQTYKVNFVHFLPQYLRHATLRRSQSSITSFS